MKRQETRKKIVSHETWQSLVALIRMGKARVVKEHGDGGPELAVFSASGASLGIVAERHKYLFENLMIEIGAGDGLFEGMDQTTRK